MYHYKSLIFFTISEKICFFYHCQAYISISNFYKFLVIYVSVCCYESLHLFFTTTDSKYPAISNEVFLGDQPCGNYHHIQCFSDFSIIKSWWVTQLHILFVPKVISGSACGLFRVGLLWVELDTWLSESTLLDLDTKEC
jgi:hypothetical protein